MERVLAAHRVLPPLGADVEEDPTRYSGWVRHRERRRQGPGGAGTGAQVLTLLMTLPGEPAPETVQSLQALQRQTSSAWSLTVVIERAWQSAFTALLSVSGLARSSQRVRVHTVDDAATPGAMLRHALGVTAGEHRALLFPGDLWAPDAVAQLSAALTPTTVVYADEDSIGADGDHTRPRLKPSYSPDFLLSSSYLGRPVAFGSGLSAEPEVSDAPLAGVEHDIALQLCERASSVVHVPEVLCHRLVPGPAAPSGSAHVVAALDRRGEAATVTQGPAGTFRVRHRASRSRTSIIIPFRDEPQLTRACIESIDSTRGDADIEFVLIDNGSVQPETHTLIERMGRRADVQVLRDTRPFNWSELNNEAAARAGGDLFMFLNNDIEAIAPGWIEALTAHAERPGVGAVGARLVYPDRRLQHGGVVIGMGGAAGHVLVGLDPGQGGYLNMAVTTRECAAVTGACLVTSRRCFAELGGFDHTLGSDLNDVDYCLRAQRLGLRVLYEGSAELIHHESPSRGFAGGTGDIIRFIDRWSASIEAGDPYLHPALTRRDPSCALRHGDEAGWWRHWYEELGPN